MTVETDGPLGFAQATILTITDPAGAITVDQVKHTVAAFSGTADELVTISTNWDLSTGFEGVLYLKADAGDTITIKHNTGNIYIPGGGDVNMTEFSMAGFVYNGTKWVLATILGQAQTYTVTNGTTSRTFDADTVTLPQLADIVYTKLLDDSASGLIKLA
jgi:hypothetical protein